MNCNEFELLLADALGDELSDADRPAFEQHLSQCENCRREYDAAMGTVHTLQSLTGPQLVSIERENDRLIIREASSTLSEDSTTASASPSMKPFRFGLMRYAASVLIAFTAGYGLHAGMMVTGSGNPTQTADPISHNAAIVNTASSDFQSALISVHTKNPARSDLAKGMIAMFANKR